ncbi:hypothetical protein FN846DRAFT_931606 [Sphaerosporella brunnea]|uniref:NmrA-like domain-containing protein n=1 Tax=Sphaerosporella brunnea TaxID=1250544 RepID=A0A5J5F887_9PEZI|nr:hypothetical protein FN846DRAFT_931606 [Sphaerosporella brunnea]
MTTIQNVAVAGGTGNLGSYIVQALVAANFNVTVLTRPTSNSTNKLPTIRYQQTDYSPSSLSSVLQGQDALVCSLGVFGTLDQTHLIDACLNNGISRIVLSEFGNAPHQARLPELDFARTSKKAVLDYAIQKSSENPEFSWSALATGNFIDWAISRFPAEMGFCFPERKARIYDNGEERITGTCIRRIAEAVVGILKRPEETKNRFLRVRSLEASQNEILGAFEEVMGAKWTVEYVNSKEVLERAKEKLAKGDKGAVLDLVSVQLWQEGMGRSIVVSREEADNELLGIPEDDLRTVVKGILEDKF